jgi:hypothetical protein
MTAVQQIETATVLGTITGAGNASVTVTAMNMTNTPKTLAVAVQLGDNASVVAQAIRYALATDIDVAGFFFVSGSGANVVLTARSANTNDTSLNIAITNGTCTGLTPAPTSTNTTAGVAEASPTDGYCTLAELKLETVLNATNVVWADGVNQFLCDIITAVSRAIDGQTGRYFYKSAAHEVRYFMAKNWSRVFTGDFVSITALYTDDLGGSRSYPHLWTTDDYDLFPDNAAALSEPEPYRWIQAQQRSSSRFPINQSRGVKLDAVFGWPQVPQAIQKACLLWSYETYKAYQTPLSEAAGDPVTTGQVLKLVPMDPRIKTLIMNYAVYN